MSRFEDRLWAELVEQHGALLADAPALPVMATPAGRARRARRVGHAHRAPSLRARLAMAGTLALAISAALVIAIGGLRSGGGSAAYAVVQNPDGTVSVTIREIVGVDGASSKLTSLGVPVRVARTAKGCNPRAEGYVPARLRPSVSHRIAVLTGGPGHASIVVDPAAIPPGDTVLIGAQPFGSGPRRESKVGLSVSFFKGRAPDCVRPFVIGA